MGAFDRLLKTIKFSNHVEPPLDKVQLDAAQERVVQRSSELTTATDELTKMLRRMKRKPTRGRK